jgi:cell division septal protein FtsQ
MFKRKKRLRNHKRAYRKKVFVLFFGLVVIFATVGGSLFFLTHRSETVSVSPQTFAAHIPQKTDPASLILLKKLLVENQIVYTNIKASDGAYTISLSDGSEVIFSSQKDMVLQISSLQFILSRLTMEGKLFKRLDLRFDKPVIVVK